MARIQYNTEVKPADSGVSLLGKGGARVRRVRLLGAKCKGALTLRVL